MKKKTRTAGIACLLFALACSFPALAQQDTQDRLNRLENEIQTLSRALFKGDAPPAGSFPTGNAASPEMQANLEVRLSQLEMEVRNLTGRLEQGEYESRQFQARLEKALTDMELRLMDMEARLSGRKPLAETPGDYGALPGSAERDTAVKAESTYVPPDLTVQDQQLTVPAEEAAAATISAAQGEPGAAASLGTLSQQESTGEYTTTTDPTEAYEQAFSLLKDQKYDEAEKAFDFFLKTYPDHSLSPNALYWLGETFYVRNSFERAARVFAEAYQKYPQGAKGPDNLLKLALSLAGMGKTADACLTLSQLKREYPAGANPVLVRADQEMTRLGCI